MLKEIVIAIQSYFQAHRFINKHRLWKWILIPGIIYAILFFAGIYLFWISSNHAIDYLFSITGAKAWMQALQDGWLRFLFIFGQVILHMILLLFYFSLFKYLFLILGSPLFAYLSEKTESILEEKEYPFSFSQFLKDIARGIKIALRNSLWQTVYTVSLLILSFIPLAGSVTPVVGLFTECYYLGFSMLDYTFERNNLSASQSIAFIGRHKGLAIGNGIVFYLMHLVFFVGWVLAPSYAVIAATLSLHNSGLSSDTQNLNLHKINS
ncbi:EI24 domain-containing protein [Ferruginibacter albus]|uniref:EI24 domain-containing protein n=1 Tax=Ferruginibacter albus TaxID=2875540 RepID=UPI001CC41979|nr:EI24 domain-containing protein [Ferruginibacter albus]UAY51409.1 EI24 domain-containing protein [Ferruginibacter albus]